MPEKKKATDKEILSDPLVLKWLTTVTSKRTRTVYTGAVKAFFGWLGQTPTEFVQAVIEDNRKDIVERQNLALSTLLEFHSYASTDMPKRSHYSKKIIGKGLSYNATKTIMGGVRSFLGQYGILVKLTGRYGLKPKGRNPNERMRLTIEQVRSLVAHARLPRDRAIIVFIAQTGCDINTLVSLKFGDIKAALEGEPPAMLEIFRAKASNPYYTFIGKDGIEALRAYIQDLKQRGIELQPVSPLWLTEKKSEPMSEYNVGKVLRLCAIKAGLINGGDPFNIAGGHALREFFSSALNDAKVPKNYIDEMLGHVPSPMDQAYFKHNAQALKEEYARAQGALSITAQADTGAISRIKQEFGDHIEAQIMKNRQIEAKNADLENRLTALIAENQGMRSELQDIKAKLTKIEALAKRLEAIEEDSINAVKDLHKYQ